jgi:Nucleotidyl transferase AbiEii toxin, Type IV TA system
MNFEEVRKLTITALFSDDFLFEHLVLKGGNAMSLVLRISPRVSLDLDFSMEADFENLDEIRIRMEKALANRFRTAGFIPFDVRLTAKPSTPPVLPWWGGYELNFKLIDENRHRALGSDRDRLGREALVLGPKQQKVFTVDFSKCEYTAGKVSAELDDYTIYIYPPPMIASEKLRAICQQMEDYAPTGRTKHPRARDFFDIYKMIPRKVSTSLRLSLPRKRYRFRCWPKSPISETSTVTIGRAFELLWRNSLRSTTTTSTSFSTRSSHYNPLGWNSRQFRSYA